MKIALVSKSNKRSKRLFDLLSKDHDVELIDHKGVLGCGLDRIEPDWVFVFHWSHIISKSIYSKHKCVAFHTGNLPGDRGGSPVQNQILRGTRFSRVNAIVVQDPVDSGAVYCSKEITLQGTLSDIWDSITDSVYDLIQVCIKTNPTPIEQVGEESTYKRKKDNILKLTTVESIYDQIRMLDGEGYPNTCLEINGFRLDLSRATVVDGKVLADIKIYEI